MNECNDCVKIKHVGLSDNLIFTTVISLDKTYCGEIIERAGDSLSIRNIAVSKPMYEAVLSYVKSNNTGTVSIDSINEYCYEVVRTSPECDDLKYYIVDKQTSKLYFTGLDSVISNNNRIPELVHTVKSYQP